MRYKMKIKNFHFIKSKNSLNFSVRMYSAVRPRRFYRRCENGKIFDFPCEIEKFFKFFCEMTWWGLGELKEEKSGS